MNLIVEWNNILLEAIRAVGKLPSTSLDRDRGGPPQVARSISIVHTTIYDAWCAYDSVAKPVHRTTPRKPVPQHTEANRRKAISQAAYRTLIDQFPPSIFDPVFKTAYESMLAKQLAKEGIVIGGPTPPPVDVGNQAADDVLAFRHSDNSNQSGLYADTTGYAPVNRPMSVLLPADPDAIDFPGRWQPLSYLNSDHELKTPKFICPHWQHVKPFALTSGDQCRPPTAPQPPLSQGFLDQARHVIDIQARLTPEQKVIAEYWADGPNSELPPGHWTEFAAFVVERDNLDVNQSVKLFFALSNAVFDASIATWDAKVAFDYVRPVTAIRHMFRGKRILAWGGAGKGTQEITGEFWKPFQVPTFPTPPFAEFTSGHSGFSMAAATILKTFTNSDTFGFYYSQDVPLKADPTEPVTDIVLHWPTFTAAAREAGESRLYGGIHFYEGNVVGLDLGEKVGNGAYAKAKDLWSGA
ncbi:MAG: phosphatase PAP2 family protein [Nitrospira sp.]|nr:phosphatase PAP2 family protein [Nitrospira sp.]MCW5787830.1 phosphatase PAP2 family protein [Nitrospira sp.]